MINVKNSIGMLLEGEYVNKLRTENIEEFYKVKGNLIGILVALCNKFRLNTKFLR